MTSAVMIAELVKDEEAPWMEYGKGGKPITQKKLADLLKEFGIRRPHNVRPATGGQAKGYHRADFKDAWEPVILHLNDTYRIEARLPDIPGMANAAALITRPRAIMSSM
jgi:hypothetical protein